MNTRNWKSLAAAAACAAVTLLMSTSPAYATYWGGPGDTIWRNDTDHCWRTDFWTPEMATRECDPDLVPKKAEPKEVAEPEEPEPAPEPKLMTMSLGEKTFFDFDKAVLTPKARATLDNLIGRMADLVSISRVSVTGHADRIGTDAYNDKLSMRRAQTVANYLKRNSNVSPGAINVDGRGEREPIVACRGRRGADLIRCLAPNRRVEVDVVGSQRVQQ